MVIAPASQYVAFVERSPGVSVLTVFTCVLIANGVKLLNTLTLKTTVWFFTDRYKAIKKRIRNVFGMRFSKII